MAVILILTVSYNDVIGKEDQLPWSLPNNQKRLKVLTSGKTVVMGRKTWDSLPIEDKLLSGRRNLVLSRDRSINAPGAEIVSNLLTLIDKSKDDLYVIGGESVFNEAVQFADRIELTMVWGYTVGDAFFLGLKKSGWKIAWKYTHERNFIADDKHAFPYTFYTLERIREGFKPEK